MATTVSPIMRSALVPMRTAGKGRRSTSTRNWSGTSVRRTELERMPVGSPSRSSPVSSRPSSRIRSRARSSFCL